MRALERTNWNFDTKMLKNTTYSASVKALDDFVIENGVIKGTDEFSPPKSSNYGETILETFRANPQFVGQIDGATGREERFGEMAVKSIKCALWLKRKMNIRVGDVVAICTHNQMDMYVPILASLYIGAVFNPWWDSGLDEDTTRHFVTLTRPKILFVHEASAAVALRVVKKLEIEMKFVILGGNLPGHESLSEIISSAENNKSNGETPFNASEFHCEKLASPDEPAFIVHTSGTTGLPKGIVTSHKCIFGNMPNFLRLIGQSKGQEGATTIKSVCFSSISWSLGIACMLRAFVAPETRIIYPEFNEETTFFLIEKFKINLMHLSPRMALKLEKSGAASNYDLSSLKLFWISGGVMKKETQDAIAASFPLASINQVYGSAELGGIALRQSPGFKPGSCGRIVKDFKMKVIDPATGRILGPNEEGEACFKSPFMMTGYFNNPEATRKAIDDEGWLHTGDLVQYDEEGHVFVIDRVSEMIKYKKYRLSPETIEQVLQSHPAIFDVAVVATSHVQDGEHPVAFVTKKPEAKVTGEELEKLVADALPDRMKLRGGVRFLDAVPRLLSGKVARADLKKLANQ